jgi:arylsulfatase A-like enzyme
MPHAPIVSRVIIVVLDGLRADVVPLLSLPTLTRLASRGTSSFLAETVHPSVTAAAMASLFTGVRPVDHGLASDRFQVPHPRVALEPLPRVLADAGIATRAFLARIPMAYRGLARILARTSGVHDVCATGSDAAAIFASAQKALVAERQGLFVLHWPDADRAGHAHGWTSRPYMAAARALDETLGALDALTGASSDPETLLIALADHGGGGRDFRDHDSDHPHDRTIPLVLAGGRVSTGELAPYSSLLDVPATALWALGVDVPASWAGRPLVEAFAGLAAPLRGAPDHFALAGAR